MKFDMHVKNIKNMQFNYYILKRIAMLICLSESCSELKDLQQNLKTNVTNIVLVIVLVCLRQQNIKFWN